MSVTTSPLSAEFRQKYAFYELALVKHGSVYVYEEHHSYPPLEEYGGMLKDLEHQVRENPDGSLTYTFEVPRSTLRRRTASSLTCSCRTTPRM